MALTTLSKRWSPRLYWAAAHTDDRPTLSKRWSPRLWWGSPLEKDATPPTISCDVAAGAISRSQIITLSCADTGGTFDSAAGVVHFTIWADFFGSYGELVFAGTVADGNFGDNYGNAGGVIASGNGMAVMIDRSTLDGVDGWPSAFTLRARAIDGAGNVATFARSYTITPAPAAPSVVFLPVSGSSFAFDTVTPVRATVTDASGVAHVKIFVLGATRAELVFDGAPASSAKPGYTVTKGAVSNGQRYDIERLDGWLEDFSLVVVAVDEFGTETTSTAVYTLSSYPDIGGDAVPPTVGNVQPAPGTPISSTTPVSVDVLDDTGLLRRVLVCVELEGLTELAHDGDGWLGYYAAGGSSRDPISGGFRYTVLRDGGWPSSPTLRVFAFDQGGNEN